MNYPRHDSPELERIKSEYARRESEIDRDLYCPWQPGEILMTSERKRVTATILKGIERFPQKGDKCLEIGYGKLGWLADFISWGLRETDLYGIELDEKRASHARELLPLANLEIGDAVSLKWDDGQFDYVVASTLFSSILDLNMRKQIASEIRRVLAPGGAVILYDLSVNNPRNKNLMALKPSDVDSIFPDFELRLRSVTLAPPIARFVSKQSWTLASLLSSVPFLRTHFLAILVEQCLKRG